jgi:hypothetical protein
LPYLWRDTSTQVLKAVQLATVLPDSGSRENLKIQGAQCELRISHRRRKLIAVRGNSAP